jgi:hypothetical protein
MNTFDDDTDTSPVEFKLPPRKDAPIPTAPMRDKLFPQQQKQPAEREVTAPGESAEPMNGNAVMTATPLACKLEITTDQAIDKIAEIMRLPLDPRAASFAALLRSQGSVATQTLNAQIRVDETKLRYAQPDRMAEILRKVAEVEAKLPPFKPTGGDWSHPETTKPKK